MITYQHSYVVLRFYILKTLHCSGKNKELENSIYSFFQKKIISYLFNLEKKRKARNRNSSDEFYLVIVSRDDRPLFLLPIRSKNIFPERRRCTHD